MMHMGDEAISGASAKLFEHCIKYLDNDGSETLKDLRADIKHVLKENGPTAN